MPAEKSNRKRLGPSGEAIVQAYLEGRGWQVLATNFRCPCGEMDVIAREPDSEGGVLVFIEVKTRRGRAHGLPGESVNARKQQKLIAVAGAFLAERAAGGAEPACRFDVAEVFIGADGLARVVLHRAAFGGE